MSTALPGQAQILDYGALETLFEEPVTTSVTGSPQRASDVPATMIILTAEDIRRSGAGDIPGLLRHVNGLNVLRWTNSGADVSVRGYNQVFSSRLLVLVNGRQVYADHYGYTPWSTLPVELGEIRQIEIVKGPNSALFGYNAVGGAINIVTYNPLHDDVDYATARGGTQDHAQLSAAVTTRLGDSGAIRISAGARANDDFSTPLRSMEGGTRRGDERRSLRLDMHYRLDADTELELEASYSGADQSNMVPSHTLAFEEMEARSVKALLTSDTRFGLIEASVYRNWIDNEVYAPTTFDGIHYVFPDAPVAVLSNDVTVARVENIIKPASDHTFRLTGEYRHSSLATTPFVSGTVSHDTGSVGAMWQWQILPSLSFTQALRYDALDLERSGALPGGLPLDNADWDREINELSYNSGLVWRAGEYDTLRLTVARGAQLPNLFNLGGSLHVIPVLSEQAPPELAPPGQPLPEEVYVAGLPWLEPTKVDNVELAWDRHLPGIDGQFRLAWFRGKSRGMIADFGGLVLEANILSAPMNIGNSRTRGLELSVEGETDDHWRWGLGYIHQRVNDGFEPWPTGLTFRNYEDTTPEHMVKGRLGWARGAWEADLFLRYQSDMQGIRASEELFFDPEMQVVPDVLTPIDAHAAVDARLAYRLRDGLTLSLSGQNLLHDEQRQTAGPRVERRVFATVELEF